MRLESQAMQNFLHKPHRQAELMRKVYKYIADEKARESNVTRTGRAMDIDYDIRDRSSPGPVHDDGRDR